MKKQLVSAALCALLALNSGMAITASADWHSSKSGYYYTDDETGERYKSGWHTIDNVKYYFDKNGYSVRGLKKIDGKYYYFKDNKRGGLATGWQTINGSRYYFGKNGVMCTGWKTIDGDKYYFRSNGKMASGKTTINGKTYTFGTDGKYKSGKNTASSKKSDWVEFDKTFAKKGIYMNMTRAEVKKIMGAPRYSDDLIDLYKKNDQYFSFGYKDDKLIYVSVIYNNSDDLSAIKDDLEANGYKYEDYVDDVYVYYKDIGDIKVMGCASYNPDHKASEDWMLVNRDND